MERSCAEVRSVVRLWYVVDGGWGLIGEDGWIRRAWWMVDPGVCFLFWKIGDAVCEDRDRDVAVRGEWEGYKNGLSLQVFGGITLPYRLKFEHIQSLLTTPSLL